MGGPHVAECTAYIGRWGFRDGRHRNLWFCVLRGKCLHSQSLICIFLYFSLSHTHSHSLKKFTLWLLPLCLGTLWYMYTHVKHSGQWASSPASSHIPCLGEGELSKTPFNMQGLQNKLQLTLLFVWAACAAPTPCRTTWRNASPLWRHRPSDSTALVVVLLPVEQWAL